MAHFLGGLASYTVLSPSLHTHVALVKSRSLHVSLGQEVTWKPCTSVCTGIQIQEPETQRCHMDGSMHRAHSEFNRFARRNEEEPRWGKGVPPDRGKKGNQDSSIPVEAAEWPGREHKSEGGLAPSMERPGNKVSSLFGIIFHSSILKV